MSSSITIREIAPGEGVSASSAIDLPKTCIVTGELVGLFRNGGLGTSMTGLAELLAGCGGDVTVLYTGDLDGNSNEFVDNYARAGIKLELLKKLSDEKILGRLENFYNQANAWRVYDFLADKDFDVIHFNDTMGEGVVSIVAKQCGLAFQDTLINLAIHSPTEWILHANRHLADWLGFSCFVGNEHICIEFSDVVWGPSRYLLNWLNENDYSIADQLINQQYVMPTSDLFEPGSEKLVRAAATQEPKNITPRELVFFGRLEERKGLRLFASTLSKISGFLRENQIKVVFMGKPSSVGGVNADRWIAENSVNWDFDWRIESNLGQKEAIAFLKGEGRLAVMASPIDNSPCTVYEAIQHGIPFLASTGGGIPELIHPEDRDSHLFDYSTESMAKLVRKAVNEGVTAARPAISIADNQSRWLTFHANWKDYLPKPVAPKRNAPKWAVLIDHEADERSLEACLASVQKEFGVGKKDVAIVNRETSEGTVAVDTVGRLIDDRSDITVSQTFAEWKQAGYSGVVCLRSTVEASEGVKPQLSKALGKGIAAFSGHTFVEEANQRFIGYATGAAYCIHEFKEDAGVFVVDLGYSNIDNVIAGMDDDRYYGGVIEQIHAEQGVVAPFPITLGSTTTIKNMEVKTRGEQRRVAALSGADRFSSYVSSSIGTKWYLGMVPPVQDQPAVENPDFKGRLFNVVRQNPRFAMYLKIGRNALRQMKSVSRS